MTILGGGCHAAVFLNVFSYNLYLGEYLPSKSQIENVNTVQRKISYTLGAVIFKMSSGNHQMPVRDDTLNQGCQTLKHTSVKQDKHLWNILKLNFLKL